MSGPDSLVRIGVVADTEDAAREAFAAEAAAWERLAEKAAARRAEPVEPPAEG